MRYALSALGADRPGIVAQVTELLSRHHLNVEDSQMSRLGNFFALHLILEGKQLPGPEELRELKNNLSLFHLSLDALPDHQVEAKEATHQLTIYGVDHTGILAGVTKVLAELGVNILDLSTKKQGKLYLALLDLEANSEINDQRLAEKLRAAAREEKVEMSLNRVEVADL